MRSPLFGISSEERAQLLRTKNFPQNSLSSSHYAHNNQHSTSTLVFLTGYPSFEHPSSEWHEVDSIAEAEDLLFSQAECVIEKYEGLPFALRRQASLLSMKNRRGYANVIFTNEDILRKIPEDQLYASEQNCGYNVGRWYAAGVLRKFEYNGSQIYVSDCVPEHTAFVCYKGSSDVDGVAVLFEKSGEMRLWCPLRVDLPATIAHYITQVVFDN